jgi:hypothetical protein
LRTAITLRAALHCIGVSAAGHPIAMRKSRQKCSPKACDCQSYRSISMAHDEGFTPCLCAKWRERGDPRAEKSLRQTHYSALSETAKKSLGNTAKPLFIGSIPIAASIISNNLEPVDETAKN